MAQHETLTDTRPRTAGAPPSLAWVSWLRVVAIAGVVCIHTAGLTAIAPGARGTLHGRLAIALDFGARWAVPVFVMLSGALLLDPARYRGGREVLRRRAVRLLPAVLFWNLVYLGVRRWVLDQPYGWRDVVEWSLTGRVYTALYFFWIVLGLALVTPVLMPWVASVDRRTVRWVGLAAALPVMLTVATQPLRGGGPKWVETPWTWWIGYLGCYLLGWGLRPVTLGARGTAAAVAGVLGLTSLLAWQWRNPHEPAATLERYLPAESYYTPAVLACAVLVFLVASSLGRHRGRAAAAGGGDAAARLGRRLGDATLGVFAAHLLVLQWVLTWPVLGGGDAATGVPQLLGRCAAVLVTTYALVLVAGRVPVLRKVV